MKTCLKCQVEKPLSEFYAHPKMKDGYLNKCKDCVRLYSKLSAEKKSTNPKWVESERTRHREKYHRLGYREKHRPTPEMKKQIIGNYRKRYPEKIKCGLIAKGVNPPGMHAHHWSYNEVHGKDVFFLTVKEHNLIHRHMKYDQSVFMYRKLSGELLNTRKKHENHIKKIFKLNGLNYGKSETRIHRGSNPGG